MKQTYYFSHDLNARNDIKLQNLIKEMNYEGIGFYWCIVEMLYEQNGKIELSKCEGIAFALRTDSDKIKQLISLVFETDDKYFWSNSVLKRLKIQKEKSTRAKISANKRWKNEAKNGNASMYANAMPTHSEGNAIKESKLNEIKENKKEEENSKPPAKITNKLIISKSQEITFLKEFNGLTTSELREQIIRCNAYMNMSSSNYSNPGLFFKGWLKRYMSEKIIKESKEKESKRILNNLPVMSPEQVTINLEKLAEMKKKLRLGGIN